MVDCLDCHGSLIDKGISNGLHVYECTCCHESFEVYEPK